MGLARIAHPAGRGATHFADRWRFYAFRHTFVVITVVWGVAFLAETGVQIAVIESATASAAKTSSTLLPLTVGAGVATWNVVYGRRAQRRGERAAQAAAALRQASLAMQPSPSHLMT